MAGLGDIQGQPRAVAILRAAVAARKVHHGYLFEGPAGVGKATTARALAQALNCEGGEADGCGRCRACEKIAAGTHPDLLELDMTPKGLTERMRELLGTLGFRPHEGRARVILVDPAEALAGQRAEAANVLLKTLEEPPAQTHFILVTAEPRRLPSTVRSRCQRLRFSPLSDEQIEAELGRAGIAPELARRAAAGAGGSLGRALALASEGEIADGADLETLLQAADQGGRVLTRMAAELGDREQAAALCDRLWIAFRDALLVRERVDAGRVPAARAATLRGLVGARTTSSLLRALGAVEEAAAALRGNVAPPLALEQLMLRIADGSAG